MKVSRKIILKIQNFSDKVVQEIKTHILGSVTLFFSKILPFMG